MKKFTLLMGAAAMLAFASCKKEEKTTEITTEPAAPDTEVVHETTVLPADTVVVKNEESDGTSVDVSKDGVNIDSKNGEKKTSVNVDVKK
jgi:uncharacterized lipoprotein YajG